VPFSDWEFVPVIHRKQMTYRRIPERTDIVDPVRDDATGYNFADYDAIIFVSLELPGGWPVSHGNPILSQPETVSRFETVGAQASAPASFTVLVLEEATRGRQRYQQIHRFCASHHRTACLRSARSGRARWSSARPSQRAFLQDQRSRSLLPPGWIRCD